MQSLHRQTKRWEDQAKLENKRGVYGGQCDLTGEYSDQLVPINDIMCMRCAKKYSDRPFIGYANLVRKSDLCRFCGTFYQIPSNFLAVELMVGRLVLKRYSILDRIYNQESDRDKAINKTQKHLSDLEHTYQ